MVRGVDTLTLSSKLESESTNITLPDSGCASNTRRKITGTDKSTPGCSVKDRFSSLLPPLSKIDSKSLDDIPKLTRTNRSNRHYRPRRGNHILTISPNAQKDGFPGQLIPRVNVPHTSEDITDASTLLRLFPNILQTKSKLEIEEWVETCKEYGLKVYHQEEPPGRPDRGGIEEGTSALNYPTKNVENNLDIKVLDQAAHQKSCYLGVGSWISDDGVNGINTPISSTGASREEESQESSVLLDRIASSIRSAVVETSRTEQTSRQTSNAIATPGQASRRGGSDGKQKRLARRKGNKDFEGDSEEDQKDKPNQTKKKKYAETDEKRFACPIFKHDPEFHKENPRHFRVCRGPGWGDIPRLK
jgi:hypothetical protein